MVALKRASDQSQLSLGPLVVFDAHFSRPPTGFHVMAFVPLALPTFARCAESLANHVLAKQNQHIQGTMENRLQPKENKARSWIPKQKKKLGKSKG